jgi:beta-phosphoglucomutase-like phosphatase (HAD superfamily)
MCDQRHSILADIRERVIAIARDGGDPAVVFDLDGTLFENTPRTQRILLAYAHERRDEELLRRLESVPAACYRYKIGETLDRLEVNGDRREAIASYWQRHFFTDRFLRFDEPMVGAAAYVRQLHVSGAHIIYLSGRDVPNMLFGTIECLAIHGFPVGQFGVELVLKPDPAMDDRVFKAAASKQVGERRQVVAVFDNEPAHLRELMAAMRGATGVLVESLRAGDDDLPATTPRIASFACEPGAEPGSGGGIARDADRGRSEGR